MQDKQSHTCDAYNCTYTKTNHEEGYNTNWPYAVNSTETEKSNKFCKSDLHLCGLVGCFRKQGRYTETWCDGRTGDDESSTWYRSVCAEHHKELLCAKSMCGNYRSGSVFKGADDGTRYVLPKSESKYCPQHKCYFDGCLNESTIGASCEHHVKKDACNKRGCNLEPFKGYFCKWHHCKVENCYKENHCSGHLYCKDHTG